MGHRLRRHLPGPYDEPPGRGSDIGKGITRHQRQHVLRRWGEHRNIAGLDNDERFDYVFEIATQRRELNLVPGLQILQPAKERIAVTRNTDISGLPGQRRRWNVAYGVQ